MENVIFKIVGIDLVLRASNPESMHFQVMSAVALQQRIPKVMSFRVGKVRDFGMIDFSCDEVLPAALSFVSIGELRSRQFEIWEALKIADGNKI